ncbi:hypothetical protein GCM10027435_08890 [Haloparvum alkalitolerans]|uniref:DUF7284 family protein n=1 Tax=Haloparvum alkalitolerans TaxID=1042953 RepID=UPI003CF06E2D
MTSTVLDVTVFLLCLSAGVGVLASGGAVDGGNRAASPGAVAVADVVAGTTASVEYRTAPRGEATSDADASGEKRSATHHATLAELIARGAMIEADGTRVGAGDYPEAVREVVREVLRDLRGGRIRLSAFRSPEGTVRSPFVVGEKPPPNVDVDVAVVTAPGDRRSRERDASTDRTAVAAASHGRDGDTAARGGIEAPGRVRIVVEVW